jgi:hypothetical protein
LEGGGEYVAVVKAVLGQDFVEVKEAMDTLPERATGTWSIAWDGLPFSFRQSSNHPYPFPTKVQEYNDYHWEPIGQKQTNTHLGVLPGIKEDGELPFRVGVYEPWWAFSTSSFANFWDKQSSHAVGVFIDKVAEWQDHDYAIWHASPRLEVGFYYNNSTLSFRYPLARGQRSTCLTLYDHEKDIKTMHELEQETRRLRWRDGLTYGAHISPTSYPLFLQNRYGTIDLNEVKDWVLTDDEPGHPQSIFRIGRIEKASDLEQRVFTSSFVCELPVTGTRQNNGFGPVASREIQEWWLDGFDRLRSQMTGPQRKRLTAMFLFMAYVHAGEDYMPMIPMLGGHPNFLSDVKSVPASMAFLFPHHPQASIWAQEYEKFLALNTRYHTRPDVVSWDSHGGRWTENLGTYVWAFLRPALRTDFLLKQYDGAERFTTPQIEEIGNWLVDALSAPFDGESEAILATPGFDRDRHEWGVVRPGKGPRRVYPPMGAHSERRIPPRALWYLGLSLQRYAPLTAEHLMWAARPTDQDMETLLTEPDPWTAMFPGNDNLGTNPHLHSEKYTGYGITLRAAVDTPQEVSVHLQQIDDGPNYRWGNAAEGGNGVLYFFAGGKSYSYNAVEDVGDRVDQDTDFSTNFGVWKASTFHSIGRNVLEKPLYNLGVAQFAELVPRAGPQSYAAPEYVSRSVLLAGQDYFALYDDVFNESVGHRLSWFVRNGEEFPSIQLVKGVTHGKEPQLTEIHTSATTGRWYDGMGDSMAIVSHRKDLTATSTPWGAKVNGPGVDDLVFRDPEGARFSADGIVFEGAAGIVRRRDQGYELALFHGKNIGVPGLEVATDDTDLGFSARVGGGGCSGDYVSSRGTTVRLQIDRPGERKLFVDGQVIETRREGAWIVATLVAGKHHWEITAGVPWPAAPEITRTENVNGGTTVFVKPVAAATQYRFAVSADNARTWKDVGQSNQPSFTISGLSNGTKIHVRAVAVNAGRQSDPGPEYPVYVTDKTPLPPTGLKLESFSGKIVLHWGQVLGVTEYRLYRREKGQNQFTAIYRGLQNQFSEPPAKAVVEYRVTAVNRNGEGAASEIIDTDPKSWRNWDPRPGEPFRRTSVVRHAEGVPDYYPR